MWKSTKTRPQTCSLDGLSLSLALGSLLYLQVGEIRHLDMYFIAFHCLIRFVLQIKGALEARVDSPGEAMRLLLVGEERKRRGKAWWIMILLESFVIDLLVVDFRHCQLQQPPQR